MLVDEKKAMARRGSGISLLGLDLSDGDDMETQRQIVSVLRIYLDRQRALELYGALRPEIQTHLWKTRSARSFCLLPANLLRP